MNKRHYLNEIVDRSCLPYKYRKKIRKDLGAEFDELFAQYRDEKEVVRRMGDPDEVASGIYESFLTLGEDMRPFVEYKSKRELFGMPLIHIVKSRKPPLVKNEFLSSGSTVPTARGVIAIGRRAKGLIAIGNMSCGIVAVGNLSVGLIAVSNIGIGLLGFGNLVAGLFAALGNVAIGYFTLGNLALGSSAVGNGAVGQYAMGHLAYGDRALSLESFSQLPLIDSFVESLPRYTQPFFNATVHIVQNLVGYGIIPAVLLVAAIASGIMITRKMELID